MSDDEVKSADVPSMEAPAPPPSVMVKEKGEVSYVTSFLGGFVERHSMETARETAEGLRHIASLGIYRIELVEVFEHKPLAEGEEPPPRRHA
jgi:hypothetical protein